MGATTEQAAALPVERRRFTIEEYERLTEARIFDDHARTELIGGEIYRMSAARRAFGEVEPGTGGRRHAGCMRRTNDLLFQRIGGTAVISVQLPVVIPRYDEPEPDFAILKLREDRYPDHPTPADVLILIEVSDTSLVYDRNTKLPMYARAGIPESWLVDLQAEIVERHTQPSPDGYRLTARFWRGETVTSVVLPSLALPVDAVLG